MKRIPSLFKTILVVLLISVTFASCSKSSNEPEYGGNGGASAGDSYAKIELEDGSVIELKSPSQFNGGLSPIGSFNTNLSGKGVLIIIQILHFGEPTVGQQFTLPSITARDVAGEHYRCFYYEDKETGEEGEGEVTITAVEDNRVKGTFSAIMYSESGKRATIEGKFSQELKEIIP